MRSSGLDSASASSSTAAIAGAASSARPNVAGKGEAPAGRMCECGRASSGRAENISYLLSVRYRRQAHCPMRFMFPIFQICAIAVLGSPKSRERGRKRGGRGLRDGSCDAGAAQSLWRGVGAARLRASPRAGARRRGASWRERRLAIWIRPQALEKARFAEERSLDFASPGFEFPS